MHSDRGTTFQGAERLLHEEYAKALSGSEFQACLAQDNVTWHFIPPAAPHFGGIWEAGVKSVKTHLKRVLLDQIPTYEEITTLLCQIEVVLNSRPLEPLNDQIDDLDPLTPGHFLTGGPLNLIPQCSLLEFNPNRLSRWTRLQQTLELFWNRWSNDYLLSLQHRTKWRLPEIDLKNGHMVLIRQPNMPPAKWNLVRIVDIFPGSDGHVRVVKAKQRVLSTCVQFLNLYCYR